MLAYYIVVLLPAALVLSMVLLFRFRRTMRDRANRATQDSTLGQSDGHGSRGIDAMWRRAYRG